MTELKCPICGKGFVPKRIDIRCCSTKCTTKLYRQEHRITHQKICVVCGREFEAIGNRRKYCCELCAESARSKRETERHRKKRETYELRICELCGTEFQPKTKHSRFCSKKCACRYSSNFARVGVKRLVCSECGKSFDSTTAKRKYCSPGCAKDAVRKRGYKYGASSPSATEIKNRDNNPSVSYADTSLYTRVDFPDSGENVCEKTIPQSAEPTAPFAQGSLTNEQTKGARLGQRAIGEGSEETLTEGKVNSPASERWVKMSLREISAECARRHLTYGQAQVMAQNGSLPEDWGNIK